jgi:hypothetical protein
LAKKIQKVTIETFDIKPLGMTNYNFGDEKITVPIVKFLENTTI